MRLLSPEEVISLKLTAPVPLTNHPAAVYLGSLSSGSQRTMRSSLNAIALLLTDGECDAMTLDWSKLRYRHTAAVRTALAQRLSPSTVNKMLVALRRVLQEAYRLDLIDANDYAKAIDIKSLKLSGELRGRALLLSEIRALIVSCRTDGTPIAYRDAAVIAILRSGGIRREELANLKLSALDRATGSLVIRYGKGGKTRTVYLSSEALQMVSDWLVIRGTKPGPLVCPVNKGGRVQLKHFAPDGDGIYKLVAHRASLAGIERFSPHDFRRTFFSELLEKEDLFTVQSLGGHASPSTTAKYDLRGEARKRRAVQQLGFGLE
jgi:integrase/recombinase XerD